MDTKLKKMHKKTILIITLIVMMPALILTTLYPKMEEEYLNRKEKYEQWNEEDIREKNYLAIQNNFVNYATEAVYFQYAMMLQEMQEEEVRIDVLDMYDWVSDYDMVDNETSYLVKIDTNSQTDAVTNTEDDLSVFLGGASEEVLNRYKENGYVAYLTMEFDSFGKLTNILMEPFPHTNVANMDGNPYSSVKDSIRQYENNVKYYNEQYGEEINPKELLPKNTKAVFLIHQSSGFIWEYHEGGLYDNRPEMIYAEIGVIHIIVVLAVLVALAALILPFIKPLETGWEKIFSFPFEAAAVFTVVGVGGAVLMYELVCVSRLELITEVVSAESSVGFEILGWAMSSEFVYAIVLFLNFLGWTACFFIEYIVVAHFRQFLCSPKYYLHNRFLIVIIFRWAVKKLRKLYEWVCKIDITEEINRSIVKVVLANFVILTVLCCMWFFGIMGLILYSIALYVALRKYGEKVQKQYQSVLHATREMADGNLKINMEEELGIFQPLGEELERVQEGFAKAVREEAKSQNMKSELITNVSHDLKTPLTAIITYVDLLKQEDITEEQRQSYIETLDQKSYRLKVLIEDLFEVSKANSGNMKMNLMDVDVVSLMKQVRLEMEDKIMNTDLIFRWNFPKDKVILTLDGQRTYRIFENLLNNILKYAMPGSRVYIDVKELEKEVQIIFRNISATELEYNAEQLTERFVRGDASRNSNGSGLGLAIVKSFVELQNGIFKIEVDGDLFKAIITWKK